MAKSANRQRAEIGARLSAAQALFDSNTISRQIIEYEQSAIIFAQGDASTSVMYIQAGAVRLSVLSPAGKEAVVATLGPGDFIGEGALAAQPLRIATATAVAPTRILIVPKDEMARKLHEEPEFSGRFIEYMLARNIRIEEDLIDHLFNSSEKRLARALLLLARYGKEETAPSVLPRVSQEVLAEMIGSTRSRVNFFMNRFRKLGFIEYNDGSFTINAALLSIVLHD